MTKSKNEEHNARIGTGEPGRMKTVGLISLADLPDVPPRWCECGHGEAAHEQGICLMCRCRSFAVKPAEVPEPLRPPVMHDPSTVAVVNIGGRWYTRFTTLRLPERRGFAAVGITYYMPHDEEQAL